MTSCTCNHCKPGDAERRAALYEHARQIAAEVATWPSRKLRMTLAQPGKVEAAKRRERGE